MPSRCRTTAASDRLFRIRNMVEKPKRPGRAFEPRDHRTLRSDAGDFRSIETIEPGSGGEIQLTDAPKAPAAQPADLRLSSFEGTRYDAGDKLGFLKATVEFALKRYDLGRPVPRVPEVAAVKLSLCIADEFLALAHGPPRASPTVSAEAVRLGIDLFSIRVPGWTPFEYLDYCARQGAKVVHFSEIRFIGSLEPDHLRRCVRTPRSSASRSRSECGRSARPRSLFDPKQGTAEEQLARMIEAAKIARIADRALRAGQHGRPHGAGADRRAYRRYRRRCCATCARARMDAGIKIAIENHAGDMQARELKTLIEEAGKDFVGACLDSGNPLWTIEDPHLTLETLHPYVLTSHVRDTAVWRVPKGAAVQWVRMGDGNIGIDDYVRKYARTVPGTRPVARDHRHPAAHIPLPRSEVLGRLPHARPPGSSAVFCAGRRRQTRVPAAPVRTKENGGATRARRPGSEPDDTPRSCSIS